MKSQQAQTMYGDFVQMVQESYEADKIKDGIFGAMMDVQLINDGPVTIIIESDPQKPQDTESGTRTETESNE